MKRLALLNSQGDVVTRIQVCTVMRQGDAASGAASSLPAPFQAKWRMIVARRKFKARKEELQALE